MEKDKENYFNDDYQHGYSTGMENANKVDISDETAYKSYLESQVNYEWVLDQINERKSEMTKIDLEIEQTVSFQKTYFEKLQTFSIGEKTNTQKKEQIQSQIEDNLLKIKTLEAKKIKNDTPYSLLAGILYLFAGFAFVVGDLIISHEIVAYALNIRNNIEAWSFAIGLAMLSVLLKPAYERLVEQPYLHDYNPKTKRVYAIFQGFLLVFSVGTMLILGWFRYEAYKTDKLKEGINKQIKAMQLSSQPIDALGTQGVDNQLIIQQMDEKLKAFDKLNVELVNSPWALLSFILSGVLFAIAGAICLGISFPVVQSYWYRWLQANPAIKKTKKALNAFNDALNLIEKELSEQIIQKNIAQNNLDSLPNLDELKAEKKGVLKEIEDLSKDWLKYETERRKYTYSDGFEKGITSRIDMTDEDYLSIRSAAIKELKKDEGISRGSRGNSKKMYEKLRDAITEQQLSQN